MARLGPIEKALYGVCAALLLFLASHLLRPCEVFRITSVLAFSEFEWQNTVVQATPEEGCVCRTTDDDPWVLREKDSAPQRWNVLRFEYPQLKF